MITEIRCSNLARPMGCAGYLFFKDLPPEEEGEPARQGTAAAEMLERILHWGNQFKAGMADWSLLDNPNWPSAARNGYLFEDEMKHHLIPIAKEILADRDGEVRSEGEIFWDTAAGIRIRGHLDVAFKRNKVLYVDDLKYGWKIVEAKENWQLIGYAIGEVELMMKRGEQLPTKIVLRIHQPRPYHEDGTTRSWELTLEELWGYRNQIEQRCWAIAKQGLNELVTGKHCKYCEAAAVCPAINRALYAGIEEVHEFRQDNMSNEALSNQIDLIDRIEEVMKIRKDSLKDLATHRVRAGQVVPNYVLNKSYGDRKWKAGISPEVVLQLTGKDIVKKEMLSPYQAEKMGVSKEFVNALTERHFIGVKLEREDQSKVANKVFGTQAPK